MKDFFFFYQDIFLKKLGGTFNLFILAMELNKKNLLVVVKMLAAALKQMRSFKISVTLFTQNLKQYTSRTVQMRKD